jgi:hypothetical protein
MAPADELLLLLLLLLLRIMRRLWVLLGLSVFARGVVERCAGAVGEDEGDPAE